MRWLGRSLWHAVVGVSVLLFIVTVVFWIRGYWVGEMFGRTRVTRDETYYWRYEGHVQVVGGGLMVHYRPNRRLMRDIRRVSDDWEEWTHPRVEYFHKELIRDGVFAYRFGKTQDYPQVRGEPDSPRDGPINGGRLRRIGLLGFKWASWEEDGESMAPLTDWFAYGRQLVVPLWFILLIEWAIPYFFLRGVLKRRRARQWIRSGLCGYCGYDMRGSKGNCPECGRRPGGE